MDPNLLTLFKLSLILVNMLMTRGLSDADGADQSFTQRPRLLQCNQTLLLLEMERCGERFSSDMNHVHPDDRCNLTHFIREYHVFSFCTEMNAERIGCFWPNPAVERFIISIHKHFFSNCSLEHVFIDPPDDTLTLLILVPVFLTLAMVVLVVWCSKRSDILA
ncbi:receptor activity-modifying protein 3-like isoform X2 [Sinocyclocheilus grahami]|uniref:receptor activity-modifying protein 3-like isoform X2 n=1 Tax=Sinocyclocheilus grahami TaxID=75366 RepID=UPI0007AD5C95|nr:PREDICTED: receptor activity-modifying protein 3-like isoform X2 [Sinocyclocheilus grahami]